MRAREPDRVVIANAYGEVARRVRGRPPHSNTNGLAGAGFSKPEPTEHHRIFCSSEGPEKCGKTDWALRHAPGPIAVISLDMGTEEIAQKIMAESGKEIVIWQGRVPGLGQEKQVYASEWDRLLTAHEAVIKDESIRTYVWDTATEAWELKRLAKFGKLTQIMPFHYGPLNAEMRDMVKTLYRSRPDLNCIFIHKMKKQYKQNTKGDSDSWTGKYERAGFDDFRYLVDVCLRHYYRDGEFGVRVIDDLGVGARQTADCAGLELAGDDCSFFWLAQNLYPDVDPEHWWDGISPHPLA